MTSIKLSYGSMDHIETDMFKININKLVILRFSYFRPISCMNETTWEDGDWAGIGLNEDFGPISSQMLDSYSQNIALLLYLKFKAILNYNTITVCTLFPKRT